ncbi:MAG: hypothetical protein ABIP16_08820 [Thermomonas sp.]
MTLSKVVRNAWMDLLSAGAFMGIWLWREHFEYDTLLVWLIWPVVFEMFVAVALLLAGALASIRVVEVRYCALACVALVYLASAWRVGASVGMPQAWLMAAWFLVARVLPPSGLRFGTPAHQAWVVQGAGYSGMLWGAGFVLTVVFMLVFGGPAVPDASGEMTSVSPSWIFPLVWAPYFIGEAVLKSWRKPLQGPG